MRTISYLILLSFPFFVCCNVKTETPKSAEKAVEVLEEKKETIKKEPKFSKSTVQQPKVTLPIYSVLDEDIYDAPVKAQIVLNILVSGEISELSLRALLNKLYSSIKMRKGFKYHDYPTNIYIYAFTTKERYDSGMGLWIAMLQKSYGDVNPIIDINNSQIAQLGEKPKKKFGLTEYKRKQIWNEMIKAEDRAEVEIKQKYPLPDPLKPGYSKSAVRKQIEKQVNLRETLKEKLENELAKKHGLTRKQLDEISVEGITKGWPW